MTNRTLWIVSIVALAAGFLLSCAVCFWVGRASVGERVAYRDGEAPMTLPVGDKLIEIPPGYEAVIEYEDADEAFAVAEKLRAAGTGQSPSVYESGGQIKGEFQADALTFGLNGVSAGGGGFRAKYEALGGANGVTILTVLGGLAIIGGGILLVKGPRKLGIGLLIGGALCLAAVFYPWLLLIVGALALAGLGYMIYRAWRTRQLEQEAKDKDVALKTIARGVQRVEPVKGGPVRKSISDTAKTLGTKDTVRAQVAKALGGSP